MDTESLRGQTEVISVQLLKKGRRSCSIDEELHVAHSLVNMNIKLTWIFKHEFSVQSGC